MQFTGSVTTNAPARFVPDGSSALKLRITSVPVQAAELPEGGEIDLTPYLGKKIDFEGQTSDDTWVWGVNQSIRVREQGSRTEAYRAGAAAAAGDGDLLARRDEDEMARVSERGVHVLEKGIICATDYRARKRDRSEIVLDATDGFIPLWAENHVLRWKFNEASLIPFRSPQAIKSRVRELLAAGIAAWGAAAPIRFTENSDNSDFEIVVEEHESCNPQGCTLAKAFFPDSGRHQVVIFPTMFNQIRKEQVDTMAHEVGHVFGLRHFFAPELETPWPAEIFGQHKPFSIMNYGSNSEMTDADRNDLALLYESVWDGTLTKVNGTPIKMVTPYHYLHT
jgi:hypothetical protein